MLRRCPDALRIVHPAHRRRSSTAPVCAFALHVGAGPRPARHSKIYAGRSLSPAVAIVRLSRSSRTTEISPDSTLDAHWEGADRSARGPAPCDARRHARRRRRRRARDAWSARARGLRQAVRRMPGETPAGGGEERAFPSLAFQRYGVDQSVSTDSWSSPGSAHLSQVRNLYSARPLDPAET